jgi:kynurenine formamidase
MNRIFIKSVFVLAVIIFSSCVQHKVSFIHHQPEWIDLTYAFDSSTLYWPNNQKGFNHSTDAAGITPLGFYYSSYSICTPEHGGTHLDAPIHFADNRLTVDQISLSNLTGNAVLIDVSAKALQNRDYLISVEDIKSWEKAHGMIKKHTIVLFRTGYGAYYPDRKKYFGTDKHGNEAIPELHFPGISPEATTFLVNDRVIKALGLDTPSIDYGQSKDFKTHQILMGANKAGFENVANLDKLPADNFYIVALPMKIGNGSGAPLRIIATLLK